MSKPRPIYVVSLWSIFHFQPQTDILVFVHFLESLLLFLDDNVDEESE